MIIYELLYRHTGNEAGPMRCVNSASDNARQKFHILGVALLPLLEGFHYLLQVLATAGIELAPKAIDAQLLIVAEQEC